MVLKNNNNKDCDSDFTALNDAVRGKKEKKWKFIKKICRNGDEKLKLTLQRYKNYLCGEYNSTNTLNDYFCHAKQFLKIINNNSILVENNNITKVYKWYTYQRLSHDSLCRYYDNTNWIVDTICNYSSPCFLCNLPYSY